MDEIYVYDPKYTIEINWYDAISPNSIIDRMGFVIKYGIDVVWKENNIMGIELVLKAINKAVEQLNDGKNYGN